VEASATRIEKFTAEMKNKWRVELVDSVEDLCRKVDAILIASVDGRSHLEQARVVFAAKKPVFIDKPFAASLRDAREMVRLARDSGTPFFSSSSLRFAAEIQSLKGGNLGKVLGAFTYSPAPFEPHHPDLFWYGIHGVEMLYALMGPGCESVTRVHTDGADVVVGRWKDGRTGTFRGIRDGAKTYGAVAFGSNAVIATTPPMKTDYRGLVAQIVKFFQTGRPPVAPEETLEIMAFMEAADASKARNGVAATLEDLSQH
jgi:predicted dehydrogenase